MITKLGMFVCHDYVKCVSAKTFLAPPTPNHGQYDCDGSVMELRQAGEELKATK